MRNIFLAILGAVIGILMALITSYVLSQKEVVITLPARAADPSTTELPEAKISSSQISSDGAKKLTMKVTATESSSKIYSFFTSEGNNSNERFVFGRILAGATMSIPYNTWSPDNKYFFIKEDVNALVFNESGELFDDGQKYINVTKLLGEKVPANKFAEATGWASENLLLINTTTQDGEKGPSYWFELPSRSFIQLGTQF